MSDQPEALRLADELSQAWHRPSAQIEAAAELRRLHEGDKEMLADLKSIMDTVEFYARGQLTTTENSPVAKAIAAIKKAEGTIRMAREAGIKNDCDGIWCNADQLERFTKLIVRECLEQVDKMRDFFDANGDSQEALVAEWIGYAIEKHFRVEK